MWCICFWIHFWVSMFCFIFISMFVRFFQLFTWEILATVFSFLYYFCLLLEQSNDGLINWIEKCILHSTFEKRYYRIGVISLKVLYKNFQWNHLGMENFLRKLWSIIFWVRLGNLWSFQQMVSKQFSIHMQENKPLSKPHTLWKLTYVP